MRKHLGTAAIVAGLFVGSSLLAYGAGLFSTLPQVGQTSFSGGTSTGSSGTVSTSTVPAGPPYLTGAEIIPADTQLAGGASPQTVAIPLQMIGNYWSNPRNYLGNGDLQGTQVNGTSTVTCATTSAPTTAAISADRWACDANVAMGAGRTAIVTSSPSPPTGFVNSMKVFRTSGALTQPVCVWSAVPNAASLTLAGNTVTFSAWIVALAGLAADNNNQMSMVIISGTGTDEGINSSWTASTAITPAWTGITTVTNTTQTITTTYARYAVTATIPTTATEVGVALCFTPTATGAGATDGFAFTGAQLERSSGASQFEFKPKEENVANNQKFLLSISEVTGPSWRAMCVISTTSIAKCGYNFPVPMYKIPTATYTAGFASCTTVACTALTACTSLATEALLTVLTVNGVSIACGSGAAFAAAGSAAYLADNGGSGKMTFWTGL